MQSLPLTDKRFVDFFRSQPETGMGYWIVTTVLKDGRRYPQVLIDSGHLSRVRRLPHIPVVEDDIAEINQTDAKWNWDETP